MVINTPADVAEAPFGATYTIMGISELSNNLTISFVEVRRPPSVSSKISIASECFFSASFILAFI